MNFIGGRSAIEEVITERAIAMEKVVDIVVKLMAPRIAKEGNNYSRVSAASDINKLLAGFTMEERLDIMTRAFIRVC